MKITIQKLFSKLVDNSWWSDHVHQKWLIVKSAFAKNHTWADLWNTPVSTTTWKIPMLTIICSPIKTNCITILNNSTFFLIFCNYVPLFMIIQSTPHIAIVPITMTTKITSRSIITIILATIVKTDQIPWSDYWRTFGASLIFTPRTIVGSITNPGLFDAFSIVAFEFIVGEAAKGS